MGCSFNIVIYAKWSLRSVFSATMCSSSAGRCCFFVSLHINVFYTRHSSVSVYIQIYISCRSQANTKTHTHTRAHNNPTEKKLALCMILPLELKMVYNISNGSARQMDMCVRFTFKNEYNENGFRIESDETMKCCCSCLLHTYTLNQNAFTAFSRFLFLLLRVSVSMCVFCLPILSRSFGLVTIGFYLFQAEGSIQYAIHTYSVMPIILLLIYNCTPHHHQFEHDIG